MAVLSNVVRLIFPDHVTGKFAPSFWGFRTAKMMAQMGPTRFAPSCAIIFVSHWRVQ